MSQSPPVRRAAAPDSLVRIAVLGGDGRLPARIRQMIPHGAELRHFKSVKEGGCGETRALARAIRAGGISWVIILARWNGHAGTDAIRNLCRQYRIRVDVAS